MYVAVAGDKPAMEDFTDAKKLGELVQRYNANNSHMAYDPKEPAGRTIATMFETIAERCQRQAHRIGKRSAVCAFFGDRASHHDDRVGCGGGDFRRGQVAVVVFHGNQRDGRRDVPE